MDIKDLKLQKVTDRIYYLPNLEAFDWPTLGLVIGDKHTLMLIQAGAGATPPCFLTGCAKTTCLCRICAP